MLECPCCGQAMCDEREAKARLTEEIACLRCGHIWAIASVQPMILAAVEEEQRHETD